MLAFIIYNWKMPVILFSRNKQVTIMLSAREKSTQKYH